ncbi:MAG: dihydroorotate dehydrogenase-like protein [Bacillota bacterium]|nr:dihydroorotate dehydrogenase-like protein [Bacillota bacterium]MDW7678713.1 dihydroorotate dehydrogenase-like protein [Bacillota bacterium]
MSELSSRLYGIPLKNPLVAGACSFTARPEKVKELETAGAAAVIVKSLFEEELQLEQYKLDESLEKYDNIYAEMLTHHPSTEFAGDQEHVLMVKKIKDSVSIPVIASINAVTEQGWIHYAKDLEAAGVDGLELNFYSLPLKEEISAAAIEKQQIDTLVAVKKAVSIPVGVKLSPYYTHILSFVKSLDTSGADGITLFNRFFQPEIDIMSETESVTFSFSQPGDNLLSLRWTALLSDRVSCPLTAGNGILDDDDVIKALLTGASSVQFVSTLYKNGIPHITEMLTGMQKWMELKGYTSIDDFRGRMSKDKLQDPWAYERVQYIEMLLKKGILD